MAFAQLIPGLPNDLAFQCLLRLSPEELLCGQTVSSLWRIAITSERFYVERRLRFPYPSICIIRRIQSGYQILDTDATHLATPRILFSCDLVAGQMLFPHGIVFATVGASVFALAPGKHAQKFSLITRRWIPVGRTMPSECTLLATSVGEHVIVVACKPSHAVRGHSDPSDGALQHTICEAFDSHNNQWARMEGLPEDFYGIHSFVFQGIAYVRGIVPREGLHAAFSVYALDLGKRRWGEDVHMRDRMHSVGLDTKFIVKPDALLMASWGPDDTVVLQHQKAGTSEWMDVVRVTVKALSDFFIFQQGDEVFLGITDAGERGHSRKPFYYHGLVMLFIPSEELLLVESIVA